MKGFQRIGALANRMRKLGVELADGQVLRELIIQNEDYILNLNRDQLNEEGVNSKGQEIASYMPYTPATIAHKKKKGQPYDRVTLRDTGKFQAGFKLVVTKGSYRVTSSDSKTDALVEKYGPYIFGLTSENRDQLISEVLIPAILEHIDKTLGE